MCHALVQLGKGNRRAKTCCHLCGTAKPRGSPSKAELEKLKADAKALADAAPAAADDGDDGFRPVPPRRKSKKARRAAAKVKAAGEVVAAPVAAADKPKVKAKAKAKAGAKDKPSPPQQPAKEAVAEDAMESDWDDEEPLPTVEEMDALRISLWPPHELRPDWSAAAVVEEVVDDDDLPPSADTTTAYKAELQQCITIIAMGAAAAALGVDLKVTRSRKSELEKLLAKTGLEASAAKSAVGAAQLRLHKAEYLVDYSVTLNRSLAGASKARTRFVGLQLAQQKHVNLWQEAMQNTATEEAKRQTLWDERVALLLARHGQVLQEFERRISAAALLAKETPEPVAAAHPPARKEWRVAPSACWDDLYLTAGVSPSELPTPAPATAEALLLELQALWGGIEAVSAMPGDTPASYTQLGASAATVRDLVGLDVWRKYYDGRDVSDDDVAPRNLLLRVSTQLTKLAETHQDSTIVGANVASARQRLETAFQTQLTVGKGSGKGKGANPQY